MAGYLPSCLMVLGLVSVVVGSNPYLVQAPAGKIQGEEMTATNGQTYVGFRGIPYAKPPVGELRFSKPQPHPVFDGIFEANKPPAECPQPDHLLVFIEDQEQGQEDCLVLNIYAKEVSKDVKKVLVFIHGGGFIVGSSKIYDAGTFVTEHDVIMVTINYRLGVLGFLSTENEASLGNYGMWDQTLALKWVKDNIASFGGDADNIAIGGESAGGASVGILSITPFTKGLFTKAYPMSGTATSVFASSVDAQVSALEVAKGANCWEGETDKKIGLAESEAVMKCLRERPMSDFTKFSSFTVGKSQFVPRADGEFLPQHPSKLIKDDQYLESVGYFARSYLFGLDNMERAIMQNYLEMTQGFIASMNDTSEEDKALMAANIESDTKKFYIGSRLGIEKPSEALINKVMEWYDRRFVDSSLSEMVTDLSFLIPTYDYLDALARRNSKNVRLFYFNHYPAFMKGKYRGIPHGVDLAYWFDVRLDMMEKLLQAGMKGDMDQEDLELKHMLGSMIAEFVRSGNPEKALSTKLSSPWPYYDLNGSLYLDFNNDPTIKSGLERERRKLWAETIPSWVSGPPQDAAHTEL